MVQVVFHYLKKEDWIIYAFEPTPELVNYIKSQVGENKRYNIKFIKFNIAGHHDW